MKIDFRNVESRLASSVQERDRFRRYFVKWYNKNRLLENAIRDAHKRCMAASTPDEAQAAMTDLVRRVPKNQRPRIR